MKLTLLDQVDAFLDRLRLGRDTALVAVSGGPDSMALLRILTTLQAGGRLGRLVAAHLNHQLRGQESDEDEAFVQDALAQLQRTAANLGVRSHRIDVAEVARTRGDNLENCARHLRYDWLSQIAREEGATWVATGHTANDQAETVLHRLIRGTGLQGLCGIPARRPLAEGIEVVRPLLTVRRDDVLAYLQAENQPYHCDSSNTDLGYTRNRIRHELLPELARRYNPAIVDTLCRLAEQAAESQGRIVAEANELLAEAELPRAGTMLIFDASRLAQSPRYLVREVFRLVWQREGWPMGGMDYDSWDGLAGVVFAEMPSVDLPGGIRVRRVGRVVQAGMV